MVFLALSFDVISMVKLSLIKNYCTIVGVHDLKSGGMIALSVIILIICSFHLMKEAIQVCFRMQFN